MTTHNRFVSMVLGVSLALALALPATAAVRIGRSSGGSSGPDRDRGSTLLPLPDDLEQHLGGFDPSTGGGETPSEPDLGGFDPGLLDQAGLGGGGDSGATVQTRVPTPEPGAGVLLGLGLVLLGSARRRRCIIDG